MELSDNCWVLLRGCVSV